MSDDEEAEVRALFRRFVEAQEVQARAASRLATAQERMANDIEQLAESEQ